MSRVWHLPASPHGPFSHLLPTSPSSPVCQFGPPANRSIAHEPKFAPSPRINFLLLIQIPPRPGIFLNPDRGTKPRKRFLAPGPDFPLSPRTHPAWGFGHFQIRSGGKKEPWAVVLIRTKFMVPRVVFGAGARSGVDPS